MVASASTAAQSTKEPVPVARGQLQGGKRGEPGMFRHGKHKARFPGNRTGSWSS